MSQAATKPLPYRCPHHEDRRFLTPDACDARMAQAKKTSKGFRINPQFEFCRDCKGPALAPDEPAAWPVGVTGAELANLGGKACRDFTHGPGGTLVEWKHSGKHQNESIDDQLSNTLKLQRNQHQKPKRPKPNQGKKAAGPAPKALPANNPPKDSALKIPARVSQKAIFMLKLRVLFGRREAAALKTISGDNADPAQCVEACRDALDLARVVVDMAMYGMPKAIQERAKRELER